MLRSWHERRLLDRGEGKVGLIIAIIVLLFVVHVGMKLIPFRIHAAEFSDYVEDEARRYVSGQQTQDEFLDRLIHKASELDLPVNDANIDIKDQNARVRVTIEYEKTLDMIWGDWKREMKVEKEQQRF